MNHKQEKENLRKTFSTVFVFFVVIGFPYETLEQMRRTLTKKKFVLFSGGVIYMRIKMCYERKCGKYWHKNTVYFICVLSQYFLISTTQTCCVCCVHGWGSKARLKWVIGAFRTREWWEVCLLCVYVQKYSRNAYDILGKAAHELGVGCFRK